MDIGTLEVIINGKIDYLYSMVKDMDVKDVCNDPDAYYHNMREKSHMLGEIKALENILSIIKD